MCLLSAPSTPPPLKPRPGAFYPIFSIFSNPLLSCDNPIMSAPITPPTIRPGGFCSPPISPGAPPPPPSINCVTTPNSAFERFSPFLPRLQRSEVPAFGEQVFPPQLKPPSPRNPVKFLSPGPPKPANERLWKRSGGLRIVSVSLRARHNSYATILMEFNFRCLLGLLSQIHRVGRAWLVSVLSFPFHKQQSTSLQAIRTFQ